MEEEHCRQELSPRLQPAWHGGRERSGTHLSLHHSLSHHSSSSHHVLGKVSRISRGASPPLHRKTRSLLVVWFLSKGTRNSTARLHDSKSRSSVPLNQITGANRHLVSMFYRPVFLSFLSCKDESTEICKFLSLQKKKWQRSQYF